jgi:hypothetical protein
VVPTEHATQWLAADVCASAEAPYVPAGQLMQTVAFRAAVEWVPTTQSLQSPSASCSVTAVLLLVYLPAAQSVQLLAPMLSLYWPLGHMEHATVAASSVVASELAALLKRPTAHDVQTTSALAVAAVVVYSPAAHLLVVAQAAPSSAVEKLVPTSHAVHARSAVAVPSADLPEPMPQSCTAVQGVPSTVVLKFASATQSVHVRSTLVLGVFVAPLPVPQVAHAAHHVTVSYPVSAAFQLPPAQFAQTRSEVSVAAVNVSSPAVQ